MFAQKCNQPHGIVLDKCKFCEPEKYLKFGDEYRLRENDIVVNSTGTGTLGRVGLFRAEYLRPYGYESIVPDSHVMIVRANEKIVSPYLYLYMKQGWVYQWINDNANGSTNQKELYPQTLVELLVPLPPLVIQRAIVARLEKELGEADKLAAKFKRVAELADNAFKAELDETFKALEDNSRRDAEARRVRLGDVCEFRRGLTYSKSDESELSSNVVLRSNNVSLETGKLDFTELKYLRETFVIPADKKVVQNSLLMCMANGSKPHLGKVALIDKDYGYAFGGFMGLLVPNDIDQKYLYLALTSSQFKSRIKSLQDGANINNLKYIDIADFQFPLPPLPAQRAIVAKLDAAKERCEKLKAAAMRGHAAAENLRKAILAEAFEQ